jgi:alkanesulfonate monooxygenase SsuD/methylene tetrahydromethanopterin reductase-like flavin-dependent oxidoreductase (luciferase family)
MRFFAFHLMPYPYLPSDFEQRYDSAWVWLPNELYDPQVGHALYHEYLDDLLLAEELGFDGVCVNEHHQNAYGLMPSPNLFAAILARQTQRVKIAVIGNALPLYDPPTRVAEEMAIIDVLSNGRLIAGMVVGGGPEYFSFSVNPSFARERFNEALELVLRAWTEPGPFEHYGKHYKLRYVNPWPRPVQQPHPPVWIPGIGSLETMELVARNRWAYMGIPYFHMRVFERNFDLFRRACHDQGYEPDPEQMGWLVPIFVGETDAEARAAFEEHVWYFVRKLLPGIDASPPGYTSPRSAVKIIGAASDFMLNCRSWEEIVEGSYVICGSPDTVTERLAERAERLGVGNLLGLFRLGSLGAEDARRSMRLFAEEVMPRLRGSGA